ncbi:MAG: serine hydrolase, partial [Clostridia bacterium]|nr:serine hydrolase [Clostridia bacterium]
MLERADRPEDVGVNSDAVYAFLKEVEDSGAENHGLVVVRHGKIAFEGYRYPYSAETPHTMFSVTKSIVSTAVGFAIDEGLLTLETKIEPYFSEYFHIKNKRWNKITVESLLTMRSGKAFTFLQDMTADYAKLFMLAPFRGNDKFLYSNNDAYMLSALLQKVTGQSVVDYLTPRLFEPLGIKKPFWETNSLGVCIGGTGLYLTVPDMAKIGYCFLNGGKYEGKRVIPAFWTEEVKKYRTDTM